jgi:hypothetical protein
MVRSFGRLHLPITRLWPIALLRSEAAKSDGGKLSMRLLTQQRLDVLDKGTISALVAVAKRTEGREPVKSRRDLSI